MKPCTDCAAAENCLDLTGSSVAGEQPPDDLEYRIDGVFTKIMYLRNAGSLVPQHSHRYEHGSMLVRGSIKVWEDGIFTGEHRAPKMLVIKAGVKHAFLSLEPETTILCIHNIARTGAVEIAAMHNIIGDA